MGEDNQRVHESTKQNLELTLIIIFIGLAFGLVGLAVPTARIMSVIVVTVGLMVGFVSYHDMYIARPSRVDASQITSPPAASITSTTESNAVGEPLPSLPKVHRLEEEQTTSLSEQTSGGVNAGSRTTIATSPTPLPVAEPAKRPRSRRAKPPKQEVASDASNGGS